MYCFGPDCRDIRGAESVVNFQGDDIVIKLTLKGIVMETGLFSPSLNIDILPVFRSGYKDFIFAIQIQIHLNEDKSIVNS